MVEPEALSALIGDIYDAALEPTLWPGVLADLAAFIGGYSGAIYRKDSSRTGNMFYGDGGISEHYTQLYFEKYVKFDPSTTAHFLTAIGETTATADYMDYAAFTRTRFYREWARPQHLVDHLTTVLERSATNISMFGVFCHERDGLADEDKRRRMLLVAPHVRRAVVVGGVIGEAVRRSDELSETLDAIRAGAFLVDADGRIVHANVAGLTMLAEESCLIALNGVLAATDREASAVLRESLRRAAEGDAALGEQGISQPAVGLGGRRHVLHVMPLSASGNSSRRSRRGSVAAVFVHQAETTGPFPPEVLARSYDLTAAELRVLLAIVEVGGIPEAAAALGVSPETVKTHLARIYQKTGTHRQTELVKLAATYWSPLMG